MADDICVGVMLPFVKLSVTLFGAEISRPDDEVGAEILPLLEVDKMSAILLVALGNVALTPMTLPFANVLFGNKL